MVGAENLGVDMEDRIEPVVAELGQTNTKQRCNWVAGDGVTALAITIEWVG